MVSFNFYRVYSVAVLVVAVSAIILVLRRLKSEEQQRLHTAKVMDVGEAVETDHLEEDAEAITRTQAITSIEDRFDLIRKFTVPAVLFVAGILLLLPYLSAVPAAYISLSAGAITVLLGISAKPLLENIISGVVITLSQPVKINDTVRIDGKYGTVEKITFLYTIVKLWNWNRWVIPNHKLLQKEFENLSAGDDQEWAYVEFCVSPFSDLEKVKILAKQSMECRYLKKSEVPSFWVMELNPDHIKCWVAGWAHNPAEAWALKSTTRRNLGKMLKNEGILFQSVQNQVSIDK